MSCAISGVVNAIAASPHPVDQAENNPHPTPKPGINIINESKVLCEKIPNASISSINSSNSSINA